MSSFDRGMAQAIVGVRRRELELCEARVDAADILPSLREPISTALSAAGALLKFVDETYRSDEDWHAVSPEAFAPLDEVRHRVEAMDETDSASIRTTLQQIVAIVEAAVKRVGTAIARVPASTSVSEAWQHVSGQIHYLLAIAVVDEDRLRVEILVRDVRASSNLARAAANAAGAAADATIGSQFDAMADGELKQARFFRQAAFGLAVVAVVLALVLLLVGTKETEDWAAISVRVLAVASLAALAAYASRIAAQHREVGVWARVVAVQLRSLDAFVTSIEDQATKDRVREVAAMRMFGAPPSLKAELSDSIAVISAVAAQSKPGNAS